MNKPNWPNNKSFAFSVFDDTDRATLENTQAVYEILSERGVYTTKSVWVQPPEQKPRIPGVDLSDEAYRRYTQELQSRGFEIALHNVSASHNTTTANRKGFERFHQYLDAYPRSFANHADNRENIYWGYKRLSGMNRALYERLSKQPEFSGEVEGSKYYWGDLSRQHLDYVRNFVFDDFNLFRADPYTPYHDPQKPDVKNWFSSSNAATLEIFLKNVTEERILQLERERGYTILYTHFCSFSSDGKPDPRFVKIMDFIAERNGWFVPVSTLLDYLKKQRGQVDITPRSLARLERRWLWQQITLKAKAKFS